MISTLLSDNGVVWNTFKQVCAVIYSHIIAYPYALICGASLPDKRIFPYRDSAGDNGSGSYVASVSYYAVVRNDGTRIDHAIIANPGLRSDDRSSADQISLPENSGWFHNGARMNDVWK